MAKFADHAKILEDFKGMVDESVASKLSESDCMRFIRARKYDAKKAAAMANKWGEWVITPIPGSNVTPETILDNPVDVNEEIYQRLMPHSNMTEDKEGRPIYWEQTGLISSRFSEISSLLTVNDLVLRHIRQQEMMVRRLQHASKKHKKPIEKQVIVFNLENLSYSIDTKAMSTFKRTVDIDEAFYPERLQHFFMINAPWFFTAIWAVISPWLDPVTSDKIKILGSDYLPTLREYIDDDQIPPELGGSAENFTWQWPYPESSGAAPHQLAKIPPSSSVDGAQDESQSETSLLNPEQVAGEVDTPRMICEK